MIQKLQTPDYNAVYDAFLGEGHGMIFRNAMTMLTMIPPAAFTEAIRKIEHETTIGPFIDPTAYLGGERFDNARDFIRLFKAVQPLRDMLEEIKQHKEASP